ncbi:MAG: hypothetical protein ACREJU_12705 [Nitrospiraceae bacterium]
MRTAHADLTRRHTREHPPSVSDLVPDVSPVWFRATLWLLLPFWMLWVGISLFYDDTLASALTVENGLLQNLTVLCYGFAGIVLLCLSIPRLVLHPASGFQRWWLLILAVGCVFVAGEEMNWGQTFLHYATPSWLEGANIQQEFSVHNLSLPGSLSGKHWANEILWWMAVSGGAVLPLALAFSERFRRLTWVLKLPIPPWTAQMYWLAAAVIPRDGFLLGRLTRDNIPSELREITIAVAVAVWAWTLWRRRERRSHLN